MLLTDTPLEDPGPPSPTPPPTAPKPSKDNARLQRLLRKASKRSGLQPPLSQPPKSFRSTLSPVNEGDLENLEPTAPQKYVPPPLNLPPRFQIRGVTHRVPSPYPKQRSFTFTISEQQSLNQYLCSPLPFQATSPRPPEASIPETSTPLPVDNCCLDSTVSMPVEASHVGLSLKRSSSPHSPLPFAPSFTSSKTAPHTTSYESHPAISTNVTSVYILPVTNQKPISPRPAENVSMRHSEAKHTNIESNKNVSGKTEMVSNTGCITNLIANKADTVDKPSSCCFPALNISQSEIPSIQVITEKGESISISSVGLEVLRNTSERDTKEIVTSQNNDVPSGSHPVVLKAIPRSPTPKVSNPPTTEKTKLASSAPNLSLLPTKPSTSEEMNLLKSPEKPRPPRKKPGGGWARLVKHLIVEPEEPTFSEQQQTQEKEETARGDAVPSSEAHQQSRSSRANKMWDALLYHMATSTKPQEKSVTEITPPLPFLRSRLPLLLHRPRFDARKLKEAASRPLRKITAFFHRRVGEKPAASFNRTASGWSIKEEVTEQTSEKNDEEKVQE